MAYNNKVGAQSSGKVKAETDFLATYPSSAGTLSDPPKETFEKFGEHVEMASFGSDLPAQDPHSRAV